LLTANERALNSANSALQRKLVELEAAQRVLEQRNRALMSLEETSRALLSTRTLRELAAQICRNARELGGADRAILYCRCEPGTLDVVAADGWDPSRLPAGVDPAILESGAPGDVAARPYPHWPPGIPYRRPDIEGAELKAGLWVPLVAQGENVGVMVVHSTRRSEFLPSEVTVLEAFAGQAALAVQRTRLVEQLQDKIGALEAAQAGLAAKERLERELELARQVQQSMLPRTFPAFPGYRFAAMNEPAREVGGDLYDVFALDGERFGVVIADVSDKGMAAALYMALSRSLILAEARREASPSAVLQQVNRLLREVGEPDMFVSVFYGVVDAATRRLRYARAGHDRPLLIRAGDVLEFGGRGSLLGVFEPDALYLSEEEVELRSGDRLALYTDGLTDIVSPEGHGYGLQRLMTLMAEHACEAPEAFNEAVFAELRRHCSGGEQFDDMTMLVVDVE
jgi:sigma-B regulation protein RsbU (phosphoserine phosphatase)